MEDSRYSGGLGMDMIKKHCIHVQHFKEENDLYKQKATPLFALLCLSQVHVLRKVLLMVLETEAWLTIHG